MKVSAITCKKCGDTLFSRTRHDMRWCTCGDVAIDGGFDYVRLAFNGAPPEVFSLEVKQTKEQLGKDWSTRKDKYGLIKKKEVNVK
jgi:hypothetical protein